ncbi:MAG: 3'(2'),5'-bisphosphate nucleotidase CysQ [Pseudomonadota bacterium]
MPDLDVPSAAEDRALLIEAVRAAGPLALKDFRLGREAASERWTKSHDDSVVTAADHAVNDALREILRDARPDYGWLSEEDADDLDRLARERLFIVDPIDGTRSFAEGKPEWCLSVAIAEAGPSGARVTAAVVFAPALDRLFAAEAGRGATLNGAPVRVSARDELQGARLLGTRNVRRPEHWRGEPPLVEMTYVQPIAYRLCLVAEGGYDGLIALRATNEWDIAAGALIVEEAGGLASETSGAAYRFNKPTPRVQGSVAGHRELQDAICRALAPRD